MLREEEKMEGMITKFRKKPVKIGAKWYPLGGR